MSMAGSSLHPGHHEANAEMGFDGESEDGEPEDADMEDADMEGAEGEELEYPLLQTGQGGHPPSFGENRTPGSG